MKPAQPFRSVAARAAAAGCVLFAGLNAQAADSSTVAAAFGNTVLATYEDGRSQKIWLHPDGAWTGLSRRNAPLAGRWSLKGGKVCLRQSQPKTLPLAYCTDLPADGRPGVQWAGRDMKGRPITLSLTKGGPSAFQDASPP